MARLKECHCDYVDFNPHNFTFKPECTKAHSSLMIVLSLEEAESFRLRHLEELDQREAAKHMHTSVSTYQRILASASKKIADSIINCKTLAIVKHS